MQGEEEREREARLAGTGAGGAAWPHAPHLPPAASSAMQEQQQQQHEVLPKEEVVPPTGCMFCGSLGSPTTCGLLRPSYLASGQLAATHHLCAFWAPGVYSAEVRARARVRMRRGGPE